MKAHPIIIALLLSTMSAQAADEPSTAAVAGSADRGQAVAALQSVAEVTLAERPDGQVVVGVSMADKPVTSRHIALLEHFTEIRRLDLQLTRVTDKDLEIVAGLRQLEDLSLYKCDDFTDAGLAHLKPLSKLRFLRLSGTNVSDKSVAVLSSMTRLERLDLATSKITSQGYKALRKKLPKTTITGFEYLGSGPD